jgi:hypothetical protein
LGREFRMNRNQLDRISPAHLIKNLNEQMRGLGGNFDGWLLERIHRA